jgi:hypothetical protein
MGSAPNNRLDYVTSFRDRHGKWRFYFRYWHKKHKLPGKPGEAAFHDAYARLLAAVESGTLGRDNVVFIHGTIGSVIEKYLAHQQGLLKARGKHPAELPDFLRHHQERSWSIQNIGSDAGCRAGDARQY